MTDKSDNLPSGAPGSAPARAPSSTTEVDTFLRKLAATPRPESGGRGRLIFAMDATASREPTWDRACHIQSQMFVETAGLGGLSIQMAFYRGFGEFRASPFVTTSDALLRLMSSVRCLGGQTQIGKVLRHAINETRETKVHALVFVGDCMEEEADILCAAAGELGLLGVPVFLFHEGGEPRAAGTFRQIATLSHGAYCPFDSGSAQQLKDLLGAVAVYAAGGHKALENYSRDKGGVALLLTDQMKKRS